VSNVEPRGLQLNRSN